MCSRNKEIMKLFHIHNLHALSGFEKMCTLPVTKIKKKDKQMNSKFPTPPCFNGTVITF